MAGSVVTVAQQKGGAGKTTVAVHLAVAWRDLGKEVALVDIDPQASLSRWHQERDPEAAFEVSKVEGWRAPSEASRLKRKHDLVVIDSPPHTETGAKVAIRAADLVVLPVQPSPMDVWATEPTIEIAQKEKVPLLIVFNRVPPRGRLADEMRAQMGALDLPIAVTQLGNRSVFAASLVDGRGVTEMGSRAGKAAAEIEALAAEVLKRL